MFFPSRTGAAIFILALGLAMFGAAEAIAGVQITIGSTSGAQGETIDVPVYLSGQAMPSTVLFSIAYDPAVLEYVSIREGAAMTLEQWIISTPSVISTKVAVAAYGGGSYIRDGEICVVRFRVVTAASTGTVLASGGGASAASLMNASIPVTVVAGDVFLNCEAAGLEAPGGVSATQGEPQRVTVTWNPVNGASAYQVYRSRTNDVSSAQAISGWLTGVTSWLDSTAAAPELAPFGCQGTQAAVAEYYYWVRARNESGCAGGFSDSALGWRGQTKLFHASEGTLEKAMPGREIGEGLYQAREDGPLALRLATDRTVDASTVWGTVASDLRASQAVRWVPVESGGGWVVFEPEEGLVAGERVVMSAGGRTVDGDVLEPVTAEFMVVEDRKGGSGALLEPAETALALPDGVGGAWRVGGDEVFDAPVRVTLPLPDGLGIADVQLCYLKQSGGETGWYPAVSVEGWLVEGPVEEVYEDGRPCLSFVVRHSGVVQLRLAVSDSQAGFAPLAGLLAGLLGIGIVQQRRKK